MWNLYTTKVNYIIEGVLYHIMNRDIDKLFNEKRRKIAFEYNNKKNKLIIFNSIVKVILVIMFFYFNLELQIYWLINKISIYYIELFLYITFIFSLYYFFSIILEYFTLYKLRKEYNLSSQSRKDWLIDNLKSFLLTILVLYPFSLLFLYFYTDYSNNWWILISIIFSIFIILLNYFLPIIIIPIFFSLKSYPQGELKDKLMKTFSNLKITIEDIYEIDLSSKTNSANAAVVGFGKTRKIILSDNLANRFNYNEIEAVLAHEIGHHVNKDTYKNIILNIILIFIVSYLTYFILPDLITFINYPVNNEITILPITFIVWGIIYFFITPIQLYFSRKFEKEADQYAYNNIEDPFDLAKAFVKLADDSLSRLEYSKWEKIFKASHPSIKSRIYSSFNFRKKGM